MKYKMCKGCNCRVYMDECNTECYNTNGGLCEQCEESKFTSVQEDPTGIFYCSKCKIRTNEKTYLTTCVICKTSLLRIGGD